MINHLLRAALFNLFATAARTRIVSFWTPMQLRNNLVHIIFNLRDGLYCDFIGDWMLISYGHFLFAKSNHPIYEGVLAQ